MTNSSSTPKGRYRGSFSVTAPTGGGQTPPPGADTRHVPQQPQSDPASEHGNAQNSPFVEPFQNEPRSEGNPWKVFGIIVIVIAVLAIVAALVFWGLHRGDGNAPGGTSNPGTTQQPSNSQQPSSSGDDTNNGNLSRAEEAAALDAWFAGIPEEAWLTKTPEELGGSAQTPLGQFCRDICIVLSDGTVVARATTEEGDKAPTIVSGYTVPEEWYGKAVILDRKKISLAMITAQAPTDEGQPLSGSVWEYSAVDGAYNYSGAGTSTGAAPAGENTDA